MDGEHGKSVLARLVTLREEALIDGDTVTHELMAACFADALRKGETPRSIAQGLLDGMPLDEQWENGMRAKVEEAVDTFDEWEAA